MVHNARLHDTLLRFVNRSVINELSNELNFLTSTRVLYDNEKNRKEPWKKFDLYTKIQNELLWSNFIDYLIDSLEEKLTTLSSYCLCVLLIYEDTNTFTQVNKVHRLRSVVNYVTYWSYISHILKKMIQTFILTNELNISLFEKLYLDLEKFLYNPKIPLIEICPLSNFDMPDTINSIPLSNSLSIRRIDIHERSILAEKLAFHEIGLDQIVNVNFALEYKFELSKGFDISAELQESEYPTSLRSIFAAVITALRLFRTGLVGTQLSLGMTTLDLRIRMGEALVGPDLLGLETEMGEYYELNKDQVVNFRNFWTIYGNLLIKIYVENSDKFKNIRTSLLRFNTGYGKRNAGDKIVDWIISLEALFSHKGDSTDSITYKLSLRGSRFSKNPSQREDFYNKLKRAYSIRSKIVHGDDWQQPEIDIRSFVSECIVKYLGELNLGLSHNEILNSIDFD